MKVEIKKITPDVAREYLKNNATNRSISEAALKKCVNAIKSNEWVTNGETIKICEDGTLLDGQHRLTAVLKTGIEIECVVVSGVKKSAFTTIDTGKTRSISDALYVIGVKKNYNFKAAALKATYTLKSGVSTTNLRSFQLTNKQAVNFYKTLIGFDDLMDAACRKNQCKTLLGSSILGATYYIFEEKQGSEKRDEFFNALESGAGLVVNSPILALRKKLFQILQEQQKISEVTRINYLISAWNNFITNKNVSYLKPRNSYTIKDIL